MVHREQALSEYQRYRREKDLVDVRTPTRYRVFKEIDFMLAGGRRSLS